MTSAPTAPLTRDQLAPKPTGDRFVWMVPSRTTPGVWWRVDMTANDGYSECSCPDWSMRRAKNVREGAKRGTRAVMCAHVHDLWVWFMANDLLPALARSETQSAIHNQ